MQDELLIEKPSVKSQHMLSSNGDLSRDPVKGKEEENPGVSVGNGIQGDNKLSDSMHMGPVATATAPLQLGTGFNASEPNINVINSSHTSTASLWSTGPMDEGLMHSINMPAVNGALPFQNFPPSNPIFNASLGMAQSQPPQRRAITASHNFPHNSHLSRHMPQQNHAQSVYMTGKAYTSWQSPQQNSWSAAPHTAHAGHPQNQANIAGLSPWNRGRSVPNLNPMPAMGNMSNRKPSPTFNHQHSGMVISPKFRRSTSYPGKGLFPQPPTFEITNTDENRELLLPYQVRHLKFTSMMFM